MKNIPTTITFTPFKPAGSDGGVKVKADRTFTFNVDDLTADFGTATEEVRTWFKTLPNGKANVQFNVEQPLRSLLASINKARWSAGYDIDASTLSNVECPACKGASEALVQTRDAQTFGVTVGRCSDVRCACCSGTGKLPLVTLDAILAASGR